MRKDYPPAFYEFTNSLPKNLGFLRVLLSQYDTLQKQLLYLLNNPCPLVCIHYIELQPELLQQTSKKLMFQGALDSKALVSFLEDYSNRVFAERAMLIEFIEDIELEEKQRLYN